jgi:NAD-dependent dihydropyrimidine dehydrogenase PreA subunit
MRIDKSKCVDCGLCKPYCPVQAIEGDEVQVNLEKCVECNVCLRSNVCPTEAFVQEKLEWPRVLRGIFSDPLGKHESTQDMGRGTEEVKTNDVTNLVTPGNVGMTVEIGRPGVSGTFADLEKVTVALAKVGVNFAPRTPVTALMSDQATGQLQKEILNERVLSAIVEFTVKEERVGDVLEELNKVKDQLDTVFSLATFYAGGSEQNYPTAEFFASHGFQASPAGKSNLGLGRP